jgi:hypothetical protein
LPRGRNSPGGGSDEDVRRSTTVTMSAGMHSRSLTGTPASSRRGCGWCAVRAGQGSGCRGSRAIRKIFSSTTVGRPQTLPRAPARHDARTDRDLINRPMNTVFSMFSANRRSARSEGGRLSRAGNR